MIRPHHQICEIEAFLTVTNIRKKVFAELSTELLFFFIKLSVCQKCKSRYVPMIYFST